MRIYDGSVVQIDGIDFVVNIETDCFAGPPWEEEDGHGPVSNWVDRPKLPGEMILLFKFSHNDGNSYRIFSRYRRYYDFQAAVKLARREGWNTAPGVFKTPGEQAAVSALADFRRLKRWCDDEWQYVYVTVRPLDEYGDILPMSASMGSVEYDPDDTSYIGCVAEELARQVISEHEYMFAAPLPKVKEVINQDDLLILPDFATPARVA